MAAVVALSKASSPSPPTSASTIPVSELLRHFHFQVLKLGALTLESFLRDPYQEPAPQENSLSNSLYHDVLLVPPLVVADHGPEKGKAAQTTAPIFILDKI